MAKRPLLILPTPEKIAPPKGHGGGGGLRLPTKGGQLATFGPIFKRLRKVLGREGGAIELRDDPSSLAPDRVVVFEIAGTIVDFFKAVSKIDGLEFMAEYEAEFAADEKFAVKDTRKGKEGQDRTDKAVAGRLYLAMPDVQVLQPALESLGQMGEG